MSENTGPGGCSASANLGGEHLWCDETAPHPALAHANREHELIWVCEVEAARFNAAAARDKDRTDG